MTKTVSEQFVGRLNANVFFAEFAFDSALLQVPPDGEIEVADHLVLVDELGLIFQVKERDPTAPAGAAELTKWFETKVRRKAVKQVAATRYLLRKHAGMAIANQKGQLIRIPVGSESLAAVVIYGAAMQPDFRPPRFCESRSAGFVHFLAAADYLRICDFLVTPTEVLDYLRFREGVAKSLVFAPGYVSEAALVGQFMGGEVSAIPNGKYERVLPALLHDREKWDLSFLARKLGDQIIYKIGDQSSTSHYRILAELAKLSRSELKQFKERFALALQAVKSNKFELPYRFSVPRTDCGFLIFAVPSDLHDDARTALQNYSVASKHELQVTKHVGLSIRNVANFIDIEWMYIDGPVRPNPEIDSLLATNYPFRKVREAMIPRYQFDAERLRQAVGDDPSLNG